MTPSDWGSQVRTSGRFPRPSEAVQRCAILHTSVTRRWYPTSFVRNWFHPGSHTIAGKSALPHVEPWPVRIAIPYSQRTDSGRVHYARNRRRPKGSSVVPKAELTPPTAPPSSLRKASHEAQSFPSWLRMIRDSPSVAECPLDVSGTVPVVEASPPADLFPVGGVGRA